MTTATSKIERCTALWAEMPQASAAAVAEAFEKKYAESCSVVTARKARPRSGNGPAESGPVTSAELRAVKEIAAKNGGLPSLATEVEKVAAVAEKLGGLGRLREVIAELNSLLD